MTRAAQAAVIRGGYTDVSVLCFPR